MKPTDKVRLTILMGTCNRLPLLKQCLPVLLKTHVSFQLIILDAGSTDGTVPYIKKRYPVIKLYEDNQKIGQAKSFNNALKHIETEYVCWLSDDNMVKGGMLDKSVKIMDSDKHIGMLGLKVKDISGPWMSEPYIGGVWPFGILNINQGMVRLKILRNIKYFDSKFPDYGIDADLTTKILLSGFKVAYTKDIVILHYRDYSSFPGAFKNNDREKRLKKAFKLYKRKYRKFEKCIHKSTHDSNNVSMSKIFLRLLLFVCKLSPINSFIYSHTGYNKRDFHNVLHARFVSLRDLWYNRKKPYYLVQQIPNNILLCLQKNPIEK